MRCWRVGLTIRRSSELFTDMVINANKTFMGLVLANAFQLDLRPRLPAITAATLILRGERDASRTPAHVAEMLDGIRGSRTAEIPGAGHSAQVDSAGAFVALVRSFLLE
jgi:pimeloyl-ACP methyl ester carboxylesterase